MNEEVKKLREDQTRRKEQLKQTYSNFSNLATFLNNNEKKFKKEESILALRRIREFLENKKKEYEQMKKEYRRVQLELYSLCSHEVIVKDSLKNNVCPICKNQFFMDYPTTTKYIIDILSYRDHQINLIIDSIINEVIFSNEDFLEYLEEKLEELEIYDDVKVLRRTIK